MLAADREVEHCKIADPRRKLQTDANGLNLLELQLGLLPRQPALVPELSLSGIDFLGFHVNLLSMKGDTVCTLADGRCPTLRRRSPSHPANGSFRGTRVIVHSTFDSAPP